MAAQYSTALVILLTLGFHTVPCRASAHDAAQCKALEAVDFSHVPDAPTQIMDVSSIRADKGLPSYCNVQGYVSPGVGIGLLLPSDHWNGKMIEVGCGGFCGGNPANFGACDDALTKGYACIASDQGHRSTGLDAKWAYNNLQAKIDYGYRAAHVAALAGKAIAEHYYDAAPKRSYFLGCSGGGRQGLVEAQRFPWDFDGIVATEPALNLSTIFMNFLWSVRVVHTEQGKPIFSDSDIQLLHHAIVSNCDLNDGIKDGLIGDSRACKFDPAELSCNLRGKAECLSPAQIDAARKVYTGPMTSTGLKLTLGGAMLGSEVGGKFGISAHQGEDLEPGLSSFSTEFFRYMGLWPEPGPGWNAKDFDFDRDYKRLGMMESVYASTDPDLHRYKARGGKLILTQGLHDSGSPFAYNSIDYFETVEKTIGDPTATRDFFRLFLVPGRNHCGGGNGAWAIDHLSYLDAWVEQGLAPDQMLGAHPKGKDFMVNFPLAPDAIQFSRPIYPYPALAHYKGRGDPNAADNFEPRNSRKGLE